MPAAAGRRIPLSPPRKWVNDLLWASRGVPVVTFERRMNLAPLAAARAALPDRPPWVALFAKAFALAAAGRPELRRAYVRWPWPHLYEAAETVVSVAVERDYRGEPAVFFGHLRAPDAQPLARLAAAVRGWQTAPVESVGPFRRLIRYTALPRPVRRFVWWWGTASSGRRRRRTSAPPG